MGALSALAVAAAPLGASADTGKLVPVRYQPATFSADPAYLTRVPGAHAFVDRDESRVSFYVHDTSLPANTRIFYVIFNSPTSCSTSVEAGKVVGGAAGMLKPHPKVVSMCDPGPDHALMSVVFGPKWAPDAHGNERLTLGVGQGPVIAGLPGGLTNPEGAEIAVLFGFPGQNDQILISSPRLERSDDSEGGD